MSGHEHFSRPANSVRISRPEMFERDFLQRGAMAPDRVTFLIAV